MKNIVKISGATLVVILFGAILLGVVLRGLASEVLPPGQMIEVGGYRLHIHCTGPDNALPTVVIETGSGAATPLYYWIQKGVSETTRVCAYDRSGLGWSEESGLPRDAEHVNEALHTLLTKVKIKKPFVFVGHSIAGLYNRDYIERYPEDVSGLVLLDPSHPRQGQEMNIDNDRFYPHLEAQLSQLKMLIKSGYIELFNPLEQGRDYELMKHYPTGIQEQLSYVSKRTETYDAFLAEFRDFEKAARQAENNKTLGDRPFTIISAGTAQSSEGWPEEIDSEEITLILRRLHTEMEALSSNSKRATVGPADHMSLILSRDYAEQTIPHIRDVIMSAAGL